MARLARVVVPGMPHHVTQRGNRRQETFFVEDDYGAYLELMTDRCREEGVAVWGYCLMPNHVHLIAVPETQQALRLAIGEAHRGYTRRINFRQKWRGYLWQGRLGSFVMDEPYLAAAARYVELNPVRANLVADAADWPWSSAEAHLSACDDRLVQVAPLLAIIDDWRGFLDSAIPEDQLRRMRNPGRTGRPLGDASFLERLEKLVGRVLRPQKPGHKPRFAK
jgi:putative transposase